MKVPQRNFVVEFKSARRQPKAKTNSIWGDTDLKALARAVEDEASHLFNSTEAPVTPDTDDITSAEPLDAASGSKGADSVEVGPPAASAVARAIVEASEQPEAKGPAAETVAQVQESQPASQPRRASRGTSRTRTARTGAITPTSVPVHSDRSTQYNTANHLISFEELDALDVENRRLKRLLAEQLRAQNSQLKRMLERFDTA
ncbi:MULTISPECIES: hypothetical protein [unclassified Sinorhizobium]|uniref:hypothetical protein n=1 Tax=unclassified Sinorhizobium TaxID=2613772 RepID=UPI0024C2184C|nr:MULTISPECIES: hypothetical protein [unclassified Sinorhizobium]MDK1376570.1 hypothetical protein [Sinorhizobium sp. 6-70]MDK1481232.1 hypothetical protein [Sinorhizobium sp. 6-117]